jgi:hypothetical protein
LIATFLGEGKNEEEKSGSLGRRRKWGQNKGKCLCLLLAMERGGHPSIPHKYYYTTKYATTWKASTLHPNSIHPSSNIFMHNHHSPLPPLAIHPFVSPSMALIPILNIFVQ